MPFPLLVALVASWVLKLPEALYPNFIHAIRWTVSSDRLFPRMKSDHFLAYHVEGEGMGRTLVLTARNHGLMGFDVDSGRKLWELESQ